jgi:hypothetical protein
MKYAGLIEIALTFGGFMLFIIWQMRTLKRDIRAREEREARERAEASEPAELGRRRRRVDQNVVISRPGAASGTEASP